MEDELDDGSGFQFPGDGERSPWDKDFVALGHNCYDYFADIGMKPGQEA